MYEPLKFVEQMEGYIQIPNQRNVETLLNNKAIALAKSYMSSHRTKLFHDYGVSRKLGSLSRDELMQYQVDASRFMKTLGIEVGFDSLDDFLDLMLYYDTRELWRKNKLSYLVDEALFNELIVMNTPELAPMDCLTKLPASCFYIDYNGQGNQIMKDLIGTFINTSNNDGELNIALIHLVHSNSINRVMIATSVLRISDTESVKFGTDIINSTPDVDIPCEDGITRTISESSMWRFLLNFLIYLQASNRDVSVSERTRKNHEKPQKTIKNKFREVKEFEVGFTYGRTISKDAERVKYIGKSDKTGVVTRPISSHYRSAHWHHYWVGSGEDKKLIIKWVEGVFVNGGKEEAKNIQVHRVK